MNFEYINPHTPLALISICSNNCPLNVNITWNIYQNSNRTNQWILLDNDHYLLGKHTNKLTILKDFFAENDQIIYWRFQVIYSFEFGIYQSTFDIEINQPPSPGSCTIDPLYGSMNTLFTINCSNWYDKDQIKDYTFYGYTKDKMILGFSIESVYQFKNYQLQLMKYLHLKFSFIFEIHLIQ